MRKSGSRLTITIMGAAGKMGARITRNLTKTNHDLFFCEKGESGIATLGAMGLHNSDVERAVPVSDVIIMAVPDSKIGEISKDIVPLMKDDATLILLDPAAAYAGELVMRSGCTFVVTHPCHPPLFGNQDSIEARRDLFGGIAAKQDIVIALAQGKEENLQIAQRICVEMFAPVVKCHRITVEQMAILEPAAAEVVAASAVTIMKEALNEAVRSGVPEEAARAFMLGHIQIPLAIVFGETSSPFSDAAKVAIQYGLERVFRPDWRDVFKPEAIREAIGRMLHSEQVKS